LLRRPDFLGQFHLEKKVRPGWILDAAQQFYSRFRGAVINEIITINCKKFS